MLGASLSLMVALLALCCCEAAADGQMCLRLRGGEHQITKPESRGWTFILSSSTSFLLLLHLTVCVFASAASKKAGEPLIISDITKGSVAHRSEPLLLFPHQKEQGRHQVQIPSYCSRVPGFNYLYLTPVFLSLATFDLESLQLYRSLCTCCCFHWKNTAVTDHSHSCTYGYAPIPQLWGQRSAK